MVKRSSKVLSMVMAFTMFASMFAAPKTFAAPFEGSDPVEATLETAFIEMDENNTRQLANGANFATVSYSKGDTVLTPNESGKIEGLIIGETYNIKVEQTEAQAAAYTLSNAGLSVNLEADGFYDRYNTPISLTSSTNSVSKVVTYTGSFTALGAANKVVTGANSDLQLYIHLVRNNTVKVTAVANNQLGTNSTAGNYKAVPLNEDGTEAPDGFVLKSGKDAYFKVTTDLGHHIARPVVGSSNDESNLKIAVLKSDGTTLTVTGLTHLESAAKDKGAGVCKITAADVDRILQS